MEEKKEKILNNKKAVGLLAAGIMALAFGATWAFYESTQSLANPLLTAHSGAAVVEEYNPDSSFLPGETVIKKVAFENTGEMDIFLRVEVEPEESWTWVENRVIKSDPDLLTSMVQKSWTAEWGSQNAAGNWPDTEWWSKSIEQNGKTYRYYKRILEPGDRTADILESITLSPDVSNDRHDIDYSGKTYTLTFNAEAVPVEELNGQISLSSLWRPTTNSNGVTVTEDGEDGNGKTKVSWSFASASGE